MNTRRLKDRVASTRAFDGLSKVQKILFLKVNNLKAIQHGMDVASNIGFDEFERRTNFSYSNRMVIKELLDEQV